MTVKNVTNNTNFYKNLDKKYENEEEQRNKIQDIILKNTGLEEDVKKFKEYILTDGGNNS